MNIMESRECRICLDAGNTRNLIAPCLCSGTSKWVHRKCLDRWRAESTAAFYSCSSCRFAYRIEQVPHSGLVSLCCLYWLLVVRDVLLLLAGITAVAVGFGFVVFKFDADGKPRIRDALFPMHVSDIVAYYVVGWIIMLIVGGIVACVSWGPATRDESTRGSSSCVYFDTGTTNTDGEGGAIIILICLAACALVGFFAALFQMAKWIAEIAQRHAHVLERRVDAKTMQVADLERTSIP